ncbi:hypothetical protein [Ohtaekwangia sp.]|uniref:hypothetical protein n=1 Tax=Ohtaekwangia sp. TaxID=2066019 RepID=UPI002FDD77D1
MRFDRIGCHEMFTISNIPANVCTGIVKYKERVFLSAKRCAARAHLVDYYFQAGVTSRKVAPLINIKHLICETIYVYGVE